MLRKYIRKIGENQNPIDPESASKDWVEQSTDWNNEQVNINKINNKTKKLLGEEER